MMRSYGNIPYVQTVVVLFSLLSGLAQPAWSTSLFQVTIDTAALTGTPTQLAFDLLDSDSAANHATISDFRTDGSLGGV